MALPHQDESYQTHLFTAQSHTYTSQSYTYPPFYSHTTYATPILHSLHIPYMCLSFTTTSVSPCSPFPVSSTHGNNHVESHAHISCPQANIALVAPIF